MTNNDRIEKLLANPSVDENTEGFIRSLLDSIERWGKLTERQEKALESVESRYTIEAIRRRETWASEWDEEKRRIAVICARYYKATGTYFMDLSTRVLTDPDFVPTEKQYNVMCCNKYAKKVIENAVGTPKYPVGTFVDFRSGTPRSVLRSTPGPVHTALVLGVDVDTVTTHAKGGKKYSVLPVGSIIPVTIEERYLKKSKKKQKSA